MKGESPDARIPCGPVWPSPERSLVHSMLKRVSGERLCLVLLFLVIHNPLYLRASVLSFDSIQFWAGTGKNQAAMMIQWNDGGTPASLLWGYRWNGTATGFDMFRSIAGTTAVKNPVSQANSLSYIGSDSRLAASWTEFDFGNALDSVVFNYDANFRTRTDWTTGYWEYNVFGGQFNYDAYDSDGNFLGISTYNRAGSYDYSGVEWISSPIGSSDRILIDGSWDAWSFADNFVPASIINPTPTSPPPPTCKSVRRISSADLEILFTTTVNISYQLESKNDLLAPTWTALGEPWNASSSETVFTVTINPQAERQFYRLRQLP